jgi:uncharacterized membrane protein YeaQ/YmgE (transglycosylase-associated protein family)
MPILTWIVLGLMAGFVGSKIVNKTGEGITLVLGVAGAVVGGYLFSVFGAQGVSGLNLYSIVVAVVGAVVVLVFYQAVTGSARTSV